MLVPWDRWRALREPAAVCDPCRKEINPQGLRALYVLRCELAGARESYRKMSERVRSLEERVTRIREAQEEVETVLVRKLDP